MNAPSPRPEAPQADIDVTRIAIADARAALLADVERGLLRRPRRMPPKYFYDERGSELFDRICDTPEYYPTRTESQLLEKHAENIMRLAGPRHLLELGSGTSRKTRHLLRAWPDDGPRTYWPLDVSEEMLLRSAGELSEEFPNIDVSVIVADYGDGLDRLPATPEATLYAFLGGTIGNFAHAEGARFLAQIGTRMKSSDHLLVGIDRVKETEVLNAAYNDAQGLTAAFNLNLLAVLNRELGADFDLDRFSHVARYDEEREQIEMYLRSRADQVVRLPALGQTLALAEGEEILTEISRKFTPQSIDRLLADAGLQRVRRYEPDNQYYSLVLARAKD